MSRQVRTFWVMRQRYRRSANMVTVLGALAGLATLAAIWPTVPVVWLQRDFVAGAIALVVLAALVPRLLVKMYWRMLRRRNYEHWG